MLGHALCHALSFHSQTITHSITNNQSYYQNNQSYWKTINPTTDLLLLGKIYAPNTTDSSPDRSHKKKNKQRKRFQTTTTDYESEVHVDTEVATVVDTDNERRLILRLKLQTKQAAPAQLTRN